MADFMLISQIEAALTKQTCSGFNNNSLCLAESTGPSFSHQRIMWVVALVFQAKQGGLCTVLVKIILRTKFHMAIFLYYVFWNCIQVLLSFVFASVKCFYNVNVLLFKHNVLLT